MRNKVIGVVVAGLIALAPAGVAMAGSQGYEGQPGNQSSGGSHGNTGYEGQPGNQSSGGNHGNTGYEGQPGNQSR